MSLFAVLEAEGYLQLNDKTRFNGAKSFNSKATSEITSATIAPGYGATAVNVFDADSNHWYLDWAFGTFKIDIDSGNADIKFEVGSTEYSGTVASGSYTLAEFATALQTAMNAQLSGFTVSANSTTYVLTVSHSSSSFEFLSSSVTTQGFFKLDVTATSHVSDKIEYGERIITLSIANSEPLTGTAKAYVKVYTEDGDHLFCGDKDITAHEPDVLKWVPDGRASFKDVYRKSQKLIIAWLDEKGYVNVFNQKFTKNDIVDVDEVKQWATFMSLKLIFQGIKNAVDDVFDQKAKYYEGLEKQAIQRAVLRIDVNKDGEVDATEGPSIYSGSLLRR